jgi:hypothetical protein
MPRMLTITELQQELARREKMLAKVYAKREKVAAKVAAIDRQVVALGGEPLLPTGKRGGLARAGKLGPKRAARRGDDSLVAHVRKVLAKAKGGMKVADIAAAVKAGGYKSDAQNFPNLVAVALRGKEFRRPARGVYELRDKPSAGGKKPRKAVRKPSEPTAQPPEAAAQQATGG